MVTDKFVDWPENLPREDLITLLRSYADECRLVTQVVATAFPEQYPAGDGEIIPAHERVVIDEDALVMAGKAVAEIARLRETVTGLRKMATTEIRQHQLSTLTEDDFDNFF